MRRNDLDICADILEIACTGAKKTHLVYKANLNFVVLKKYLKRLFKGGLIENQDGIFFTTDEGFSYIEKYRRTVLPLTVV